MGLPSRRMSSNALRIWLWSWLLQNVSSCMVWMLLFWPGRQRAKSDLKGWGGEGGEVVVGFAGLRYRQAWVWAHLTWRCRERRLSGRGAGI